MKTIIAILALVLLASSALASGVRVSWNPSEQATGYMIWYGTTSRDATWLHPTDGEYEFVINAGNVSTIDIINLPPGDWYFAATAYNDMGESAYSNEVSATIETMPLRESRIHQPYAEATAISINIAPTEP